jgi:thymidylate synthase|tara:strand:+ start:2726 stop:3442 length:717 start_codon:yes stop_codon:yes gene_type:complete
MLKRKGINSVIGELKQKLFDEEFIIDKEGTKTVEVINANFEADSSYILREPNLDYVQREVDWYNSQSLNVNDIDGKLPKIWLNISSDNGFINSNYGYLIHNSENHDQYENAAWALLQDPTSRRAIMIYTRPSMHYDYDSCGMNDFVCTNTVQYLLRDGFLDVIVNMRSNDAVYGYNNDWHWQRYVQENMCRTLNDSGTNWADIFDGIVRPGKIHWNAGSFHVYERHFKILEDYNESDS